MLSYDKLNKIQMKVWQIENGYCSKVTEDDKIEMIQRQIKVKTLYFLTHNNTLNVYVPSPMIIDLKCLKDEPVRGLAKKS